MASWLGPGKHEHVDLICGGSILLFRDNPCPHLGNIVTIKLSENQENVPQTDNTYLTMIVETHFQVISNIYYFLFVPKFVASHFIQLLLIITDELQHWGVEADKEVPPVGGCSPAATAAAIEKHFSSSHGFCCKTSSGDLFLLE